MTRGRRSRRSCVSGVPPVGAVALALTVVTSLAVVPTANPQSVRCAVAAEGGTLPVDVPLPHDRSTGAGVAVAVVDTGASSPGVVAGDGREGSGDLDHCVLHGTAVAGVIRSVAPDALVVSHRQLTDHGGGTVAGLVDALDRAVANSGGPGAPGSPRVRVVNMSLVACQDTAELRRAVADAENAGLLVVAAAGNSGQCGAEQQPFPASLPGVLAVGGVEMRHPDPATLDDLGRGRRTAEYSLPGPWVEIAAPGGPVSTVLDTGGRTVTVVGDPEPFIGTSFAAPVVAATAALVWQVRPELTPQQVRTLLVESASPGPVPVVDPSAAVTAASAGEPVRTDGDARPAPAVPATMPATTPPHLRDPRVPTALALLVSAIVVGTVIRRRPRAVPDMRTR